MSTCANDDPPERCRDTDGRAVADAEIRIVDPVTHRRRAAGREGEVWIRGPELFAGYADAAQTEAAVHRGWFRSGDLGVIDEGGWLTITGRLKDLIIRGGENIAAAEVEHALEAHPDITRAVVVGCPDDTAGRAGGSVRRRPGNHRCRRVPPMVRRVRDGPVQDARGRRPGRRTATARRPESPIGPCSRPGPRAWRGHRDRVRRRRRDAGRCRREWTMDLALTADERGFRDEIRRWLAANLDATASLPDRWTRSSSGGRTWQARLAADRWVGIHWPSDFGGRGASPLEVAIFNMEYARSGAPQPVNRNGINHVGPTLLAHGTEEQKARWLPRILDAAGDLVPAVQRAWLRLRPGVADHPGRAGGRWLGPPGPEGLDQLRAVRPVGHRAGTDRPRRPQTPRALLPGGRHDRPGHRDPAAGHA